MSQITPGSPLTWQCHESNDGYHSAIYYEDNFMIFSPYIDVHTYGCFQISPRIWSLDTLTKKRWTKKLRRINMAKIKTFITHVTQALNSYQTYYIFRVNWTITKSWLLSVNKYYLTSRSTLKRAVATSKYQVFHITFSLHFYFSIICFSSLHLILLLFSMPRLFPRTATL